MHSWTRMAELLEMVDRPQTLGMQADMAHTLLFTLGHNSPEDSLLPEGYDWSNKEVLYEALGQVTEDACARGSRICTSHRMTRRSKVRARTTRLDATACQMIRMAN